MRISEIPIFIYLDSTKPIQFNIGAFKWAQSKSRFDPHFLTEHSVTGE